MKINQSHTEKKHSAQLQQHGFTGIERISNLNLNILILSPYSFCHLILPHHYCEQLP